MGHPRPFENQIPKGAAPAMAQIGVYWCPMLDGIVPLEALMNALLLIACLLGSAVRMPLQTPPAQSDVQDEDYAVYSEVLRARFATKDVQHLVIGDHTMMEFPPLMMGMTGFGDNAELKKIRETASKGMFEEYEKKNKSPVKLENKFSLDVPVVLLSESERDKIFGIKGIADKKSANPKGFAELARVYSKPQGFMNLSRIAFNPQKTLALVYVGNLCGGLCGSGEILLLVNDNGIWKIKYAATTWVS